MITSTKFVINVPASSANLGPGFDVLGLALSLWLRVDVEVPAYEPDEASSDFRCQIACSGDGSDKISTACDKNLITKVAQVVFRQHAVQKFPPQVLIKTDNQIPLGRGLGSSGAAIVAGVMLANAIAGLELSRDRMMEFCLMAEPHPDNIGASLFGGFIGSFLAPISTPKTAPNQAQDAEIEADAHPEGNPLLRKNIAPKTTANYLRFPWSPTIKTILIIPDYEVDTESARAVLSTSYDRADLVFNLQRVALLTHLLGQQPPNAGMIYQAMQDRVHQQQRTDLVHGLDALLKLTPDDTPGLLGICLSGAGPTILALATDHFEDIASKVIEMITQAGKAKTPDGNISVRWELLEPALEGASCCSS